MVQPWRKNSITWQNRNVLLWLIFKVVITNHPNFANRSHYTNATNQHIFTYSFMCIQPQCLTVQFSYLQINWLVLLLKHGYGTGTEISTPIVFSIIHLVISGHIWTICHLRKKRIVSTSIDYTASCDQVLRLFTRRGTVSQSPTFFLFISTLDFIS